jgi:hypothetical protein
MFGKEGPGADKTLPANKNEKQFRQFIKVGFPDETPPCGNAPCFKMSPAVCCGGGIAHTPQFDMFEMLTSAADSLTHIEYCTKTNDLGKKEQNEKRQSERH